MKKSLTIITILLLSAQAALASTTDEHIVWRRQPIAITLPVGKERMLTFPSAVSFGYARAQLPASTLRVINNNQTLYLLARKAFATQRMQAKLANGEIILLDLNARKSADNNPIDIVLPEKTHSNSKSEVSKQASYIDLARFAIQQLYSPRRLLSNSYHIKRAPMETKHVVPLFYDGSVVAMPIASWQQGGHYVTAISLKNNIETALKLKRNQLCGDWQAGSFYPQNQLLLGHKSMVFLISRMTFWDAMKECS